MGQMTQFIHVFCVLKRCCEIALFWEDHPITWLNINFTADKIITIVCPFVLTGYYNDMHAKALVYLARTQPWGHDDDWVIGLWTFLKSKGWDCQWCIWPLCDSKSHTELWSVSYVHVWSAWQTRLDTMLGPRIIVETTVFCRRLRYMMTFWDVHVNHIFERPRGSLLMQNILPSCCFAIIGYRITEG